MKMNLKGNRLSVSLLGNKVGEEVEPPSRFKSWRRCHCWWLI